ncbi:MULTISPECIES: hypothetical protein [Streptomyces]|nr:hypothetical protein [Streptomyces sp. GbtcB7]
MIVVKARPTAMTLLIIGIVVFPAALIYLGMHLWRSGRRHHGVLR